MKWKLGQDVPSANYTEGKTPALSYPQQETMADTCTKDNSRPGKMLRPCWAIANTEARVRIVTITEIKPNTRLPWSLVYPIKLAKQKNLPSSNHGPESSHILFCTETFEVFGQHTAVS